ncbi:MAG: hypothetical protein QOJ23_4843 [Actinomycetota bacterium]|nr:hypothetical protein [Actinomycetota bacterium]MDQ1502132.1 hypothetical protein [Actinomycetota bacterium]MDQ1566053.1 hypothetical protein [Actinomycetota bacterium]
MDLETRAEERRRTVKMPMGDRPTKPRPKLATRVVHRPLTGQTALGSGGAVRMRASVVDQIELGGRGDAPPGTNASQPLAAPGPSEAAGEVSLGCPTVRAAPGRGRPRTPHAPTNHTQVYVRVRHAHVGMSPPCSVEQETSSISGFRGSSALPATWTRRAPAWAVNGGLRDEEGARGSRPLISDRELCRRVPIR